jgi:RNA polymerase sigma-70 factor (ECF subfamily)
MSANANDAPPRGPSAAAEARTTTSQRQARMRSLVDQHARFVTHTLRRAGVPRAELDDEVQRTFIVAAARLDDVRQDAERSFLHQVALNTASHARRTLARRREYLRDSLPERIEPHGTPEDLAVRKQVGAVVNQAVAAMHESLRAVVVLYELEELDTHQISKTLGIPRGTVASRLRRARAQLRRNLAAIELASELGIARDIEVEGPAPLRRERVGALARALLRAGAATRASAATHTRTLHACLAAS